VLGARPDHLQRQSPQRDDCDDDDQAGVSHAVPPGLGECLLPGEHYPILGRAIPVASTRRRAACASR
jgi:hypothetical protein